MVYSVTLLLFILGSVVGSFLNVVVLRYGTGNSIVGGRSKCFSCSRPLFYYELVPIFSFVFLGGRCRTCRSALSLQYPLLELVTGIVFALTAFSTLNFDGATPHINVYQLFSIGYNLILFSLLITMSSYDIKHKIIPNALVYLFASLAFLKIFIATFFFDSVLFPGIWDILAGPILALPFAILWFVSRGRWMGFGDVKLALGAGWFLGLSSGSAAMVLSFWIGAAASLLILGATRLGLFHRLGSVTMKSEVPFGPFIALSVFIVFLFGLSITDVIHLFGI